MLTVLFSPLSMNSQVSLMVCPRFQGSVSLAWHIPRCRLWTPSRRNYGFLIVIMIPSSYTSKIRMADSITSEAALVPCCKYPHPLLVLCFEVQLSLSHAIKTVTSLGSCFRRVSFLSPGTERNYSMGLQYITAFFLMRSIFFMELIENSGLLPVRIFTYLPFLSKFTITYTSHNTVFQISPLQGPIPLYSLSASTNIIQNLPYYFNNHLFFWYLTPCKFPFC